MPSSPTSPARPESAPDGAESLPGVIDLYAAHDAARAGNDPAALDAASIALHVARKHWREIKQYMQAVALAEWEASQEGNK